MVPSQPVSTVGRSTIAHQMQVGLERWHGCCACHQRDILDSVRKHTRLSLGPVFSNAGPFFWPAAIPKTFEIAAPFGSENKALGRLLVNVPQSEGFGMSRAEDFY